MTAAEILRSAAPPPDDELIEKAIADLDTKIWAWADALKTAHDQLQVSFAPPPVPAADTEPSPITKKPTVKPSAALYDVAPSSDLSAAAAAAHIPSPPPMPAEWTAPESAKAPVADGASDRLAKDMPWRVKDADGQPAPPASTGVQSAWPEQPTDLTAKMPAEVSPSKSSSSDADGVMSWPTSQSGGWPDSSGSADASSGAQAWPTWTPTDSSAKDPSAKPVRKGAGGKPIAQRMATRQAKSPIKTSIEGPSPEEKAKRAAEEEALLAKLDEAIARRVRLLRRLDPDTPIDHLIDKAKQGQAEAASAPSTTGDKSSWWRRK